MGGKLYFKTIKTAFPNFITKGNVLAEPLNPSAEPADFRREKSENHSIKCLINSTDASTSAIIML
jgi:hypothetical protein